MSNRVFIFLGFAVGFATLACGCERGRKSRLRRDADAGPAVVLVDNQGKNRQSEQEPNDDEAARATRLAISDPEPATWTGNLATPEDRDSFAVAVVENGILSLRVTGAIDADLVLELWDDGTKLVTSDSGPMGTEEGIPNWPVKRGTYVASISEYAPKTTRSSHPGGAARTGQSLDYELRARIASLDSADAQIIELEPNDDLMTAGTLSLGKSAAGYVGWRRDRDVWRIDVTGIGDDEALSVDLSPVSGLALAVTVKDAAEVDLLGRQAGIGEAVAIPNIALHEGDTACFVSVEATARAKGKLANIDERYSLRVSATPFILDEEAEPNDNPAHASELSDVSGEDNGIRVGFLGQGDIDVFSISKAPVAQVLQVTLEPPSPVDAALAIVDPRGQVIGTESDSGKYGATERLVDVTIPANMLLFVRVAARPGGDSRGVRRQVERYRLRWSLEPAGIAPRDLEMPTGGGNETAPSGD